MKRLSKHHTGCHVKKYEWVFSTRIQLEGQRSSDKTAMRGSFAACFSHSGRYLAVATQYGVISIFLTELLTNDDIDPLVISFTTSRPNVEPGAVRAMEFSPDSFDLLAWAEASGRIGVVDVRDLFISRQIVYIDSRGEGVERVWVTEHTNDPTTLEDRLDARLRTSRSESPFHSPNSATPNYLRLDLNRQQQLRTLTREMTDRHQLPPTVDEIEILQAHRMARRQRDAAREAQASESSSAWYPSDGERPTDSATPHEGSSITERRIHTNDPPRADVLEYVNSARNPGSWTAFIDRYYQDQDGHAAQSEIMQQPTAQLSDPMVDGENQRSLRTSGDTFSNFRRLSITPRIQTNSSSRHQTSSSAWADFEAMYRTRYPPLPVEAVDEEIRTLAQTSRQPWRPLDALTRLSLEVRSDSLLLRREREAREPVDTMGIAWSEDGRLLYVLSYIYRLHS